MELSTNIKLALLVAGGLIAGSALGYFAPHPYVPFTDTTVTRQGGYEFINPLLSCDISEDVPYDGYDSLQNKIDSLTKSLIANGEATRVSVYFRNMNNAYWTGVKANDTFAPASLMKVAPLIAYLRAAATTTGYLNQKLTLPVAVDYNAEETIKPSSPLALGQSYTLNDLLHAMIVRSDNNAAEILLEHISERSIDDVYNNFAVSPVIDTTKDVVSPIEYMRFFRILYNATYLGRTNSRNALQMLSETEFKDGLVAGIPVGTVVAHKFGERSIDIENGSAVTVEKKELHDCGIVYYPGNPYGICIMTEGKDFNSLKGVIAQVSSAVYSEVVKGLLSQ